jgi:hypothetical protein
MLGLAPPIGGDSLGRTSPHGVGAVLVDRVRAVGDAARMEVMPESDIQRHPSVSGKGYLPGCLEDEFWDVRLTIINADITHSGDALRLSS